MSITDTERTILSALAEDYMCKFFQDFDIDFVNWSYRQSKFLDNI